MANIQVAELSPAGSELFVDSESFLNDLQDVDTMSVYGGEGHGGGVVSVTPKILEAILVDEAIVNVVSLAKSFSHNSTDSLSASTSTTSHSY